MYCFVLNICVKQYSIWQNSKLYPPEYNKSHLQCSQLDIVQQVFLGPFRASFPKFGYRSSADSFSYHLRSYHQSKVENFLKYLSAPGIPDQKYERIGEWGERIEHLRRKWINEMKSCALDNIVSIFSLHNFNFSRFIHYCAHEWWNTVRINSC